MRQPPQSRLNLLDVLVLLGLGWLLGLFWREIAHLIWRLVGWLAS